MEESTAFKERTFGFFPTAHEIRRTVKKEQLKNGNYFGDNQDKYNVSHIP